MQQGAIPRRRYRQTRMSVILNGMNRSALLLILLIAGIFDLTAQSVSAFDVASVKPSQSDSKFDCKTLPGGRFICHNAPLQYLLLSAFADKPLTPRGRVPRFKGAPGWINDECDIDAIAEGAGEMTWPQLARPLYALLQQRFTLVAHLETVQEAGFYLELQSADAATRRGCGQQKRRQRPCHRQYRTRRQVRFQISLQLLVSRARARRSHATGWRKFCL